MYMKTSNPALRENYFQDISFEVIDEPMTVRGTMQKTTLSMLLLIGAALVTWNQFASGAAVSSWMMLGGIGGFITAMVTLFKKEWSPVTVPIYALLEGLFLGAISAMYSTAFYPGIVLQAVALTMGTALVMLLVYQSNLIPVTDRLRMGIVAATGGIVLLYLLTWILSAFGWAVPLIHQSGWIGIGFSLLVVGVAAFNLLLDFDFIERAAANRSPKYMEWFGAFGLILTLVWLYIEFLRLLSKLRD